jgi:hypothetical protein
MAARFNAWLEVHQLATILLIFALMGAAGAIERGIEQHPHVINHKEKLHAQHHPRG